MDSNRIDDRLASMSAAVECLKTALAGPLPGGTAHLRMASRPRPGWRPDGAPEGTRPAAVMLVLYPRDDIPHLLLTRRPRDLPAHGGQISLPGGAFEDGEDAVAAALRETWEEVGVPGAEIDPIGSLSSLHVPVSGFLLHPIVGVATRRPHWQPSPREVEHILEVPLARLGNRDHLSVGTRQLRDRVARVPYFDLGPGTLWGATAMVIAELMWLLGAPPDPWDEGSEPVVG